MDIRDFAVAVETYGKALGGSVTSWGRTEVHNRAVGGVPNSLHVRWLAVDVVYDAPPELDVASDLASSLGLRLVRESDHDHLQANT
jgi:hypothetical protein